MMVMPIQPQLGQPMPLAGRTPWRPSIRRSVQIGQNAAEGLGVGTVLAPVIGLAISGAVAYTGMRAALGERGWNKALGWVAGIAGLLGTVSTLAWMVGFGSMADSGMANGSATAQVTSEGTI